MFNFNPFKKKEKPAPEIKTEPKPEVKEPLKPNPLEGKSAFEILGILNRAKEEIKSLEESRLQEIVQEKNMIEEFKSLGLTDEVYRQSMGVIKEARKGISKDIANIREEYGLKPTYKEILLGRMNMLEVELKRIEENDATDIRKIRGIVDNLFPESRDTYYREHEFDYFQQKSTLKDVLREYEYVPIVVEFIQKNNNEITFADILKLRKGIDSIIVAEGKYKDEERLEILRRKDKLVRLIDNIYMEVRDIKTEEGRHSKTKYF